MCTFGLLRFLTLPQAGSFFLVCLVSSQILKRFRLFFDQIERFVRISGAAIRQCEGEPWAPWGALGLLSTVGGFNSGGSTLHCLWGVSTNSGGLLFARTLYTLIRTVPYSSLSGVTTSMAPSTAHQAAQTQSGGQVTR